MEKQEKSLINSWSPLYHSADVTYKLINLRMPTFLRGAA